MFLTNIFAPEPINLIQLKDALLEKVTRRVE